MSDSYTLASGSNASRFGNHLGAASLAMSADPDRPHLRGVLWEPRTGQAREGLRLVATDGHRLNRVTVVVDESHGATTALIPADACKRIVKLCKAVPKKKNDPELSWKLVLDGKRFTFSVDATESFGSVSGHVVEETFPPYEKVIPELGGTKAVPRTGANPAYVLSAMKAAELILGGCGHVVIEATGELDPFVITAENTYDGAELVCVVMPMRI